MKRIFYRLAVACVVLAGSPFTFAACTITTAPPDWAPDAARWDGDCVGTQADGLGVLKEQQGAAVNRMFYGRAAKGELTLGVIELPKQGFVAGRFEQGQARGGDDRPSLIAAFEAAAQAAKAAAERFEHDGNSASANFYRGKEKALREQLD